MSKPKLSPPWNEYVSKITKLLGPDKEIKIDFNENERKLKLLVSNTDKRVALEYLLPSEIDFGGQKLTIIIVPSNEEKNVQEYIKDLFNNNPSVRRIENVKGVFTNPMTYVEFKNETIQYFNDNLGDLHGNRTTVMEELAREVFDKLDGVFFCTEPTDWGEF